MPFIVMFIFGAVVVGSGAMLAPAWVTKQPRMGLTAALALALVVGGAIFWAMLFGWDTLVVDYLLFALTTAIFVFGTLSFGQKRAEARGEELADKDQGWLGPNDLLLFAICLLIFAIPAITLPVPLDTDAQGFGYLGLTARLGEGFNTLAPFHPEVEYLYSPGFSALIAYLNHQLNQGLHIIQFSTAAIFGLMICLLAYDFGAELGVNGEDKRLGRAMVIAMIGGLGLFSTYMDSHFTTMMALVFAFAFLIFMFRYLRDGLMADLIAAGLLLGATVLAHPDTTIILGLGYVPFLFTMWFGKPRPPVKRWLAAAILIPIIALMGIAPWLANMRDLLGSDIVSPFERSENYWRVMLIHHAPVIPFAIVGAIVGLKRRMPMAILAVGWLIFALDFSTTGVLERLFPTLIAPVLRYDYPFSIAWHAPIIPYTILGGIGILWLWQRFGDKQFGVALYRGAPFILSGIIAVLFLIGFLVPTIVNSTKDRVGFFGAFSSWSDVAAMDWLKVNTPADARILNHPAPHETDWVPVISERDSVYFRPQPFFRNTELIEAEQAALSVFWDNPADPANADLLREAGVDYIFVPQVIGNPESYDTMVRWRRPFTDEYPMQSAVSDAPYLTLVFDADGAQIYQVNAETNE